LNVFCVRGRIQALRDWQSAYFVGMNKFLSVFSLCSRIRAPVKNFEFDASRIDFYLPVAGIFPALLVFAAAKIFFFLTNDTMTALLIALAAQYFAFNLFHLDGLIDTADAFAGCNSEEKTKAVLKDSRIGVYGFFTGLSCLALKAQVLAALFPRALKHPEFIFCYPVFGRFCAALLPCISRPSPEAGLGALAKDSKLRYAASGFALALVLWFAALAVYYTALYFTGGICYAVDIIPVSRVLLILFVLVIMMIFPALFIKHIYKRTGGYTGDALGAATETGELVFLLVSSALYYFLW